MTFQTDRILDSIIVLCEHDGKIISANYESGTLLCEMDGDLTSAQVAVVDAVLELHMGNANIETQGIRVLNPDDPIAKWKYDHDPKENVNAISLTILSFEGKRYKCKQPLAHRPAMEGVLFCKRCAALDKGTFSQIVLEEE